MPKTESAYPDNFQVARQRRITETKVFQKKTDEMIVYDSLRKCDWAFLLKDMYMRESGENKNTDHASENSKGFRTWLKLKFPDLKLDI